MHPAFRSTASAISFGVLLLALLSLPVVLSWMPPTSREQAFISMSDRMGPLGLDTAEIYGDSTDTDILIVGSSRIIWGIEGKRVEEALSAHLGRPAHVVKLANNWPGEDIHCYMLEDYLRHHRTTMILWNEPEPPDAFTNLPWVQAYHLLRYSQLSHSLSSLPLRDRVTLYGMMVLGAPRQLLSKFRPNLLGDDEKTFDAYARYDHILPVRKTGYNGSDFIPDSLPLSQSPSDYLVPLTSPTLSVVGPMPLAYQRHFIKEFASLADTHQTAVVLLHMPAINEFGNSNLPELAFWPNIIGSNHKLIGVPANTLFSGVSRDRLSHFYVDKDHFNFNGEIGFTDVVIPSILKAYDEASANRR